MKLFDLIDKELLNWCITNEYINVTKHPYFPLYIYDYTTHCALDGAWNEATMKCRGLIVDENYNIIARPFEKFFNVEELQGLNETLKIHIEIPNLPFRAFEKLDGSLGIGYWWEGKFYISTKGSFASDQAIKANEILNTKYAGVAEKLNPNYTYLFEIIYPENRIVVDYGDLEDIILTCVKNTETGEDVFEDYSSIFTCVKEYDGFTDWKKIRDMVNGDNREGFVVRFSNGFRMKMKYEDYFKKHFLKSYLTEKHVFEFYYEGKLDELNETIKGIDEENKITVEKMLKKFDYHYNRIIAEAQAEFDTLGYEVPTEPNKEIAERICKECKYCSIVFRMIRGLDYQSDVMNQLKKEIKFLEDEQ